ISGTENRGIALTEISVRRPPPQILTVKPLAFHYTVKFRDYFLEFFVIFYVNQFKFIIAHFFVAVNVYIVALVVRYKCYILFTVIIEDAHDLTFNLCAVIKLQSYEISLFDLRGFILLCHFFLLRW